CDHSRRCPISTSARPFSARRLHPAPSLFPSPTLFRSQYLDDRAADVAAPAGAEDEDEVRRRSDEAPEVRRLPPRRRTSSSSSARSEEHTSELQSPDHLVCRLLLEKKNNIHTKKDQSHN